jgi:fatty acid desaturase
MTYVETSVIKNLSRISNYKAISILAVEYFLLFLFLWLAISFNNIIISIIAICLIGARQHSLFASLGHDASHYRFLKNKKFNDLIANLFICYPMFISLKQYREVHRLHHEELNTDSDPDFFSKKNNPEFKFPQTKVQFLKNIFKYIFGIHHFISFLSKYKTFKQKVKYLIGGLKFQRTPRSHSLFTKETIIITVFNVIIIAICLYFNILAYYLLYWIAPIFLYIPFISRIRAVYEHYGIQKHEIESSRSLEVSFFDKLFFGFSWNISYHLEHHLYLTVPCYNIKKLHNALLKNKLFVQNAQITQNGFWGIMKECTI